MEKSKSKYFINKEEVINTVKLCAYSVRDVEKIINGIVSMEHMMYYPDIQNNNKTRMKELVHSLQEASDLLTKVAYTLEKERKVNES